jgi:large subunit ribosomal protein L6
MSRIGKKPIQIPNNVKVTYADKLLTVKGDKGTLERTIHPWVDLKIEDNTLTVVTVFMDKKVAAFQGLTRALIANMVTGVSVGFQRVLEVNGIGYRAELKGKIIVLNIGYSHPIEFELPESISAEVEKTSIKLLSIDKEELGQTAAAIRRLRPPEPYKGKGIKYAEEHIYKKAGKTSVAAG